MSWTVLTPPLSLKRDTSYACAFSLSLAEKLLATESAVAQKFTDAGFTGISVDMDAKRIDKVLATWVEEVDLA